MRSARLVAASLVSLVAATASVSLQTPSQPTSSQEAAQTPGEQPLPRFRAGANLVRLDAYVSQNGEAVANLTAADFEVLEDGVPQRIESFEMIRPRGPVPDAAKVEPNSVAESRSIATDADARIFVLFLDVWHVHTEGSYRAQNPVANLLNTVIGQDDLVGVMTPEMSARNLTLARRTATIEGLLRDNWFWGERQRVNTSDPRERQLQVCYPDSGQTADIAQELIDRRRERKTLDSIEDLIIHLEGIRDERKFVVLLSEGWRLPRRDDRLARMLDNRVPSAGPVYVGPDGRMSQQNRREDSSDYDSCERERFRLAAEDFELDFRNLLQRANRANVSFYTMDPRGLTVFDEDLSLRRATDVIADRDRLTLRQNALRELAINTDGIAIVNTNNLDAALKRMIADLNTYYLLGYYSTNTKLDGKFRKLSVRVKRPGVEVRARPGYLAPTEAEAASARVDRLMNGAPAGHSDTPPEFRRAIERLIPTRGTVPIRVQAAGGPGQIWVITELDAATLKAPEWAQGGRARIVIEHERGAAPPITKELTLAAGQRSFSLSAADEAMLPPGRYVIRLSLIPAAGALPLQTTVDATVPEGDALLSPSALALRRGPSTGLQYVSTADARFNRTERIRLEVPRLSQDGTPSAQLLTRDGKPLPLAVALSERVDEERKLRLIVADLTLAPLAQGEYVLEVKFQKDGKTERVAYGFRIVP